MVQAYADLSAFRVSSGCRSSCLRALGTGRTAERGPSVMPLLSAAAVQALAAYVADLDVSQDQPWMLQQLLQGSEYSSYSIAHEGHLVLHSDTEARASNLRYLDTNSREVRCHEPSTHLTHSACMFPAGMPPAPVYNNAKCTVGGHAPCVSPHVCAAFLLHGCTLPWHDNALPEHALQIWEWVKGFCKKTNVSGQLCFDFMRDSSDGRMYPFECNPRTSTILLNFYNHDHVAQAFFNAKVHWPCSHTCCC